MMRGREGHFWPEHGKLLDGCPSWKRERMGQGSHRGAKTFRRRRALEFLERLYVKRATLKQQLQTPELQPIHPVLTGELKAIEMVMNEFIQLFDIHEEELKMMPMSSNTDEAQGKEDQNEEK